MNGNYDICVSLLQYPSIEETNGGDKIIHAMQSYLPYLIRRSFLTNLI